MSRPSKRFVLPYEPEYTAHRTDSRVATQGDSARRRVADLALVRRDADNSPALDGASVELQRSESFPRRR